MLFLYLISYILLLHLIIYILFRVPFAVDGHDSPELEIFGTDGIPIEDLQRHLDGLPIVPYTKSKLIIGDASILPILAAQKASVAAQLAESKNYTVQGGGIAVSGSGSGSGSGSVEVKGIGAGVIPTGAGVIPTGSGGISPTLVGINVKSSAAEIAATAIPASIPAPGIISPPVNAAYWNTNLMAAYYPQGSYSYPPAPYQYPVQYPVQYHAQYPTQYHAQYPTQYPPQFYPPQNQQQIPFPPPPVNHQVPETLKVVNEIKTEKLPDTLDTPPLIIPATLDAITGKPIPGIIFTVPSVERSLEELRADLKKYRYNE